MAQIIPQDTISSLLGQGIGTGLGKGLESLAQNRINEMAYRGLGFGENSKHLSVLPENVQRDIIKNYWQRAGQQQPSAGEPNINELLGQQPQQQQPNANEIQNLVSKFGLPEQQKPVEQRLPELFGKKPYSPVDEALQEIDKKYGQVVERSAQEKIIKDKEKAQRILAAGKKVPEKLMQAISQAQKEPTVAEVLSREYQTPEMKQKERLFQQREAREAKKQAHKEMQESIKDSKQFRESITNQADSAKGRIRDIELLEELNQEGNLDTPGYVEFLKESGFDIPALMNPESEQFLKIQQNFLRDAKDYYGGRVSNYEVDQFLKTIPSLSQSPEGRKRVMATLKNLDRAKVEKFKTMREILRENDGVIPYDLNEQVYEHMEPKYDKLSRQFRADLKKPVPKGQNKLITALQIAAGKAIGSAGKIAKVGSGALTGAKLGAAVGGPWGAAAGGLAGGLLGGNL